ncbi:hypothetical protein QE152_g5812 [Popillia japonica]|uniref:Uncharacterized protein n=1 Tax=Popillia japonica TaxID=7064 RepID=A0AAW1MLC9_POPJA
MGLLIPSTFSHNTDEVFTPTKFLNEISRIPNVKAINSPESIATKEVIKIRSEKEERWYNLMKLFHENGERVRSNGVHLKESANSHERKMAEDSCQENDGQVDEKRSAD